MHTVPSLTLLLWICCLYCPYLEIRMLFLLFHVRFIHLLLYLLQLLLPYSILQFHPTHILVVFLMLYHFLYLLNLLQNGTEHPILHEIPSTHSYSTHWALLQIFDTVLAAGMLFHAYHHGDFGVGIKFLVADQATSIS